MGAWVVSPLSLEACKQRQVINVAWGAGKSHMIQPHASAPAPTQPLTVYLISDHRRQCPVPLRGQAEVR